ncbi:MAG TPA: secondary thiamine-phosphate synthase enzyme YjbQ [Candidatus Deferrimicrobiaceae bacterium]|jgi:secondary thiamine-phosphate synthase enzyme|nr:secondary thiamine-phosphate synthase enzyme YjbQ [Candidatus Deferrimicrobiaceae bacterium]
MVFTETFSLSAKGFCDIIDVTGKVAAAVGRSGIANGLATVFCPGSTCSLTAIEYETGVLRDLANVIEKIVPSNVPYEHDRRWGDGNGFSHVRAALLKPSISVPLVNRNLALGTWQQIVFLDFDNRERRREIIVQVVGE